jgi:hypothetical protein
MKNEKIDEKCYSFSLFVRGSILIYHQERAKWKKDFMSPFENFNPVDVMTD